MNKIILAAIAAIAIGVFASTASAGHPYYAARPSCGGGYHGGHHGGHNAYYRPPTNIRFSYGSPGYVPVPVYRNYYRPAPSFYGGYGYSPYRNGYSPYYGARGGVSFSIGF